MKKKLFGTLLPVSALAALMIGSLTACNGNSDEEKAKEVAIQLARSVAAGDTTQLGTLYPDVAKIDSLIVPDTTDIQVTTADDKQSFNVSFGPSVTINVNKQGEDKYVIKESKGLLALDAETKELASKTAWTDSTLNDVQNTERIKDKGFIGYLSGIAQKSLTSKVTVKGEKRDNYPMMVNEGKPLYVTVTNNSDAAISGSSYKVNIKYAYYGRFDDFTEHKVVAGKDIPAHGSVKLKYPSSDVGYDYQEEVTGTIVWGTASGMSMKELSTLQYTGKEYNEYQKQYKAK